MLQLPRQREIALSKTSVSLERITDVHSRTGKPDGPLPRARAHPHPIPHITNDTACRAVTPLHHSLIRLSSTLTHSPSFRFVWSSLRSAHSSAFLRDRLDELHAWRFAHAYTTKYIYTARLSRAQNMPFRPSPASDSRTPRSASRVDKRWAECPRTTCKLLPLHPILSKPPCLTGLPML